MAIILNLGDIISDYKNKFPKTCSDCPLFVQDVLGLDPYCTVNGEYTDEEIDTAKDGQLDMYYHGCLKKRPKNCPLKKINN